MLKFAKIVHANADVIFIYHFFHYSRVCVKTTQYTFLFLMQYRVSWHVPVLRFMILKPVDLSSVFYILFSKAPLCKTYCIDYEKTDLVVTTFPIFGLKSRILSRHS